MDRDEWQERQAEVQRLRAEVERLRAFLRHQALTSDYEDWVFEGMASEDDA